MTIWDIERGAPADTFLSAEQDGRVRLWDAVTAVPVFESAPGADARSLALRPRAHEGGMLLAIGRVDGTLEIIAMADPSAGRVANIGLGAIHALSWVDEHIVMVTEAGMVAWLKGEQLASAPLSDGPLLSLAVHSDGARAAIGLADGSVVVAEWWSPRAVLGGLARGSALSKTWAVDWGSNDTYAAALGGSIVVADAGSAEPAWTVTSKTFADRIYAVAWSPNGERVAHSHGPELVVRDRAGEILDSCRAHDIAVQTLRWLDDETIASGDEAGHIAVWKLGATPSHIQGS